MLKYCQNGANNGFGCKDGPNKPSQKLFFDQADSSPTLLIAYLFLEKESQGLINNRNTPLFTFPPHSHNNLPVPRSSVPLSLSHCWQLCSGQACSPSEKATAADAVGWSLPQSCCKWCNLKWCVGHWGERQTHLGEHTSQHNSNLIAVGVCSMAACRRREERQ